MAQVNLDVAMESTSQQILEAVNSVAQENTSQQILEAVNSVAMESTSQQILEAVNNVAMESTSQQILEAVQNSGGGDSTTINLGGMLDVSSTGTKTIANVNGSGELYYAYTVSKSSGYQYKLTIDGSVVLWLQYSTSSNVAHLGVIMPTQVCYGGQGGEFMLAPQYTGTYFGPTPFRSAYTTWRSLSSSLYKSDMSFDFGAVFHVTPKPIQFKNSLKIEAICSKTDSGGLGYQVCYTLNQ